LRSPCTEIAAREGDAETGVVTVCSFVAVALVATTTKRVHAAGFTVVSTRYQDLKPPYRRGDEVADAEP
jgi:hypothetical protein